MVQTALHIDIDAENTDDFRGSYVRQATGGTGVSIQDAQKLAKDIAASIRLSSRDNLAFSIDAAAAQTILCDLLTE